MELTLQFNVKGYCTQTIELADDCQFSAKDIIDALNNNNDLAILTTVHENGTLILIEEDGNEKTIGRIVQSDMYATYDEFEEV